MSNEPVNADHVYDDALVEAARDGNQAAFGQLFRGLYGRVHRTVWGMMGDESEAHDVAQAAWIKAWENRDKYNFQSLYSTWVHRSAGNCALDALRKRKRFFSRFTVLGRKSDGSNVIDPASSEPEPTTNLENAELGSTIEAAIAELPEDQRTVLVLREYEGYSYEEIAKSLDIQPGTVMSRLHHARKKLQISLSKELS